LISIEHEGGSSAYGLGWVEIAALDPHGSKDSNRSSN
jgi:hypothetical protein